MAATVLNTYKRAIMKGTALNLEDASKLKVVLVTSGHTFDSDADEFLDDILSANRVMTSDAFTGIVAATGANLDANDGVTLNDTDNGKTSTQAFLYYDTGVESTSRLIFHDDSVAISSDGTNDTLNFNASGIFDL